MTAFAADEPVYREPPALARLFVHAFALSSPLLSLVALVLPGALLARYGMEVDEDPETTLEAQLARFDLEPADIGCVIPTHLHADHAGRLDAFPMSIPVVVISVTVGLNTAQTRLSRSLA